MICDGKSVAAVPADPPLDSDAVAEPAPSILPDACATTLRACGSRHV